MTDDSNQPTTCPIVVGDEGAIQSDLIASGIVDTSDSDRQSEYSDSERDELDLHEMSNAGGTGLAYPQYDFEEDDDDDNSLFHDVGEFNNLESLSLPSAVTKDRTPAEVLQLLRNFGSPGNGRKKFRRSNSFSYSSKQSAGPPGRRHSLGSIPEDKVVTDYEELDEEDRIDSQLLRDFEKVINGISGTGIIEDVLKTGDKGRSPEESTAGTDNSEPLKKSSVSTSSCPDILLEAGTQGLEDEFSAFATAKPSKSLQTLKIVNFAWNPVSKLVYTQVSSVPMERKPSLKVSTHQDTTQLPHNHPTLEDSSLASEIMVPQETTPSLQGGGGVRPEREVSPLSQKTMTPSRTISLPFCEASCPDDVFASVTPPPHIIMSPSRRVTPPPCEPSSLLHEGASSRKITPPSCRVTPPSCEVPPLSHSTRQISPEVGGASMPPQSATKPAPMFYIGEEEETSGIEAYDFSTTGQHSLFSLSNSPMSRSVVLSGGENVMEEDRSFERCASAPTMNTSQTYHWSHRNRSAPPLSSLTNEEAKR